MSEFLFIVLAGIGAVLAYVVIADAIDDFCRRHL